MSEQEQNSPSEQPLEQPKKRAATFLGRLADALRDQNWGAVVIEIGIVVIGVVIGFQVTAWGQARSDAAKEQTYLRQLEADLVESEEILDNAVERFQRTATAAAGVAHAFWQTEPPPQDSLATWMLLPLSQRRYRPILGTAEAMVSTGDLRLISDDSLRSAIVKYIETVEANLEDVRRFDETYYRPGITALKQEIDTNGLILMRDSTDVRTGWLWSIARDYDRIPFPVDLESILKNRLAYEVYQSLLIAHRNTYFRYSAMLESTQELRTRVKKVLEK